MGKVYLKIESAREDGTLRDYLRIRVKVTKGGMLGGLFSKLPSFLPQPMLIDINIAKKIGLLPRNFEKNKTLALTRLEGNILTMHVHHECKEVEREIEKLEKEKEEQQQRKSNIISFEEEKRKRELQKQGRRVA